MYSTLNTISFSTILKKKGVISVFHIRIQLNIKKNEMTSEYESHFKNKNFARGQGNKQIEKIKQKVAMTI